jgi:hypothetical protein
MPPDVARAILRTIVAVAAPGGLVLFDYILPSVVDGTCRLVGARRHARYCAGGIEVRVGIVDEGHVPPGLMVVAPPRVSRSPPGCPRSRFLRVRDRRSLPFARRRAIWSPLTGLARLPRLVRVLLVWL